MITVQAGCPIVVEHPVSGSLAFPAGIWQFDELTTLRGTTNAIVDVSTLADGSIVVVDLNGWQSVLPGVSMQGPAINGFVVALMSVGLLLGLRSVIRRIASASGGAE